MAKNFLENTSQGGARVPRSFGCHFNNGIEGNQGAADSRLILSFGSINNYDPELDPDDQDTLQVFYQSLEYPVNFRHRLAEILNGNVRHLDLTITGLPYGAATNRGINDNNQYHEYIVRLLSIYLANIRDIPDLIVLGEYTPPPNMCQLNRSIINMAQSSIEYRLGDYVRTNVLGTRGMTILYRTNSPNWHRISIHERFLSRDHWNPYIRQVETDAQRHLMQASWRTNVVQHVGECVEIMFKNRYLAMVHVKGIGNQAIRNADEALSRMRRIHMGGDLNLDYNWNEHVVTNNQILEIGHIFRANTSCETILKNIDLQNIDNRNFQYIQRNGNFAGRTTFRTLHDGIYDQNNLRETLEISGALWPVCPNANNNNLFYTTADHKGFSLKMIINQDNEDHQDNGDGDYNLPLTPPPSPNRGGNPGR